MNEPSIKVVGTRRRTPSDGPSEFRSRAQWLQQHADRLNPNPKPRGFVFCARTWADYKAWRTSQPNPRLW
jgi:hypothetical protein